MKADQETILTPIIDSDERLVKVILRLDGVLSLRCVEAIRRLTTYFGSATPVIAASHTAAMLERA